MTSQAYLTALPTTASFTSLSVGANAVATQQYVETWIVNTTTALNNKILSGNLSVLSNTLSLPVIGVYIGSWYTTQTVISYAISLE